MYRVRSGEQVPTDAVNQELRGRLARQECRAASDSSDQVRLRLTYHASAGRQVHNLIVVNPLPIVDSNRTGRGGETCYILAVARRPKRKFRAARQSEAMNIKHLDSRVTVTDFLCSLVKDKSVLDLGCVAHTASEEASEFWVHRHLVRHAKSVLGIDILREDVEELQRRGYNVVCADATCDSLDQKFDVIVAGEIIEHLLNPGALLTNMRRHLKEDGIFVLTTPNPFYLLNLLHSMFSPERTLWHPDHVAWYCPFVLQGMFRKTGFDMEVCYYATRSRKLRRMLSSLRIPCFGWMSMTIIAVARQSPSAQYTRQNENSPLYISSPVTPTSA